MWFFKETADTPLRFLKIADVVGGAGFGFYTDATRPDGSSQGGYCLFAIKPERLEKGMAGPSMAAVNATNSLEWAVVFWAFEAEARIWMNRLRRPGGVAQKPPPTRLRRDN